MKELVILSGKGGTGKTSITAAFASILDNAILCDADVDAADLHLIASPDIQKESDFFGGYEAVINPDKCTQCGLCEEMCRFDAIHDFCVDPFACEGCGVCYDFCPEKAIEFPLKNCGKWFISDTRFGTMVHARLGIAEENSGRLVTLVRQETLKIAQKKKIDLILTDGPPGIGCPVIAAIGQADAVLTVAEPTVSGRHDLERVCQLADHFKIPVMTCINKYDLNLEQTDKIKALAEEKGIAVVGQVPFDPIFTTSMIQKKSIIETDETSQASQAVKKILDNVMAQPVMKNKSVRLNLL